jgi:hypothetical protein
MNSVGETRQWAEGYWDGQAWNPYGDPGGGHRNPHRQHNVPQLHHQHHPPLRRRGVGPSPRQDDGPTACSFQLVVSANAALVITSAAAMSALASSTACGWVKPSRGDSYR